MPSETPQDLTDVVTKAAWGSAPPTVARQRKSSRTVLTAHRSVFTKEIVPRGVDATPHPAGVQRHDLASESDGTITVVCPQESPLPFNRSGFSCVGHSPARSVPTHDAVKPRLVLLLPTGDVLQVQDFTQATKPQWLFFSGRPLQVAVRRTTWRTRSSESRKSSAA